MRQRSREVILRIKSREVAKIFPPCIRINVYVNISILVMLPASLNIDFKLSY
jgi:hypothetical protein